MERIAVALERLAAGRGVPVLPVAEQAAWQGELPEELRPLLVAVQAAKDVPGTATSLGFPPGHGRRGLAIAILHGVAAVGSPGTELSGVSTGHRITAGARRRGEQYFQEHMAFCAIAVFSEVQVATIVQCLARDFRASSELRAQHGERFLKELAQVWRGASAS
jgi:hypothetical protein